MAAKKKDEGYSLDTISPARFLATELDKAAGAALSIHDLAQKYEHLPADLHRVQLHEGAKNAQEAKEWLLRNAATSFKKHVKLDVQFDTVSFREGKSFADLRINGKEVTRDDINEHSKFGDPFNPLVGQWGANDPIRGAQERAKDDLTELHDSMKNFGWDEDFPALLDERGVVLDGRRRITVADELGIEHVTKIIHCGTGDAADAKRLRKAIIANIGRTNGTLTKHNRERLAKYLYGEHNWVMERIAEALNVSQATITNDLRGLSVTNKPRPKGGRPKGSTKDKSPRTPHSTSNSISEEMRERIRAYYPQYKSGELSQAAIGKLVGCSTIPVGKVFLEMKGAEEGRALERRRLSTPEPDATPAVAAPTVDAPATEPDAPTDDADLMAPLVAAFTVLATLVRNTLDDLDDKQHRQLTTMLGDLHYEVEHSRA